MSRNTVIVFVSIFLIIVLGITFLLCSLKILELKSVKRNADHIIDYGIEEKAPDNSNSQKREFLNFTLYRADNTEVDLSEYENKPMMMVFFDDRGEESLQVLSEVDSMYETYKDTAKFLMINTNRDVNESLKNEYKIEIFYDFYKEAVRKYNIKEFPTMIYVQKDNTIFNAKTGVPSLDSIEANLDIITENY